MDRLIVIKVKKVLLKRVKKKKLGSGFRGNYRYKDGSGKFREIQKRAVSGALRRLEMFNGLRFR